MTTEHGDGFEQILVDGFRLHVHRIEDPDVIDFETLYRLPWVLNVEVSYHRADVGTLQRVVAP